MISLTRLNGHRLTLNAFYIEKIESLPDTTITLINGKKIVVRESEHDVRRLASDYFRSVSLAASMTAEGALASKRQGG